MGEHFIKTRSQLFKVPEKYHDGLKIRFPAPGGRPESGNLLAPPFLLAEKVAFMN